MKNALLFDRGKIAIPHPPYSPDLASCGFFLSPNMKKCPPGKKFPSNEVPATRRLLCRVGEILLFGELMKVGKSFGQVRRNKRKLC